MERDGDGVDERWLLTNEERRADGLGPWTQMDDPAHVLLTDGYTSRTTVYDERCYICRDPEFSQMGLPLCRECEECGRTGRGLGHVAADDCVCSACGYDESKEER
jgi:ribosomal protein L37E